MILLFKIATFPLKTLLNAVKLITEFALPLISFYTAVLNIKMVDGIAWLFEKATEKDTHTDQLLGDRERTVPRYSKWKIGLFAIGLIPMVAAILSVLIIQYATVWACRAGRALTSPAESARRAYALGRSLQIGEEGSITRSVFSYTMGILGALVSLGVTAILWTLALPLALSTVTTWIPSLINAVNWIAQLPAVSATLTWISSTSLATGSMVLLNNLFATVGAALSASFGSMITAMAGLISVQVPAVVSAVGTTLGMLAMPVAALLSLGADKLSNLWAQWTAGVPLKLLFGGGKSYERLDYSLDSPRQQDDSQEELLRHSRAPSQNPRPDIKFDSSKDSLHMYKIQEEESYVVSPIALNLGSKNQHLVVRADLKGRTAEDAYKIATDPNHRAHGFYRLPTEEELTSAEVRAGVDDSGSALDL